eukprot:m.308753 g.308753  ORF g.308753 m.308753 type:complete len:517 (+) comp44681_c0_seq1:88-1638(+)
MSWGSELWDQYEKLLHVSEQGHDFVKRVENFVKERIEIEADYAKKLRRLCKNYKGKDRDAKQMTVKAFNVVIDDTDSLAGLRESVVENMQTKVKDQLKQLGKELVNERKKATAEGSKQIAVLQNFVEALERSKKSYEKACKDSETAQQQYDKADADLGLSRAQVEKQHQIFRQKKAVEDEATGGYSLQLQHTNKCQSDHYHKQMPAVLNVLQQMEEKRIMKLSVHLTAYSEVEYQVQGNVSACLENITKFTKAIDYQQDIRAIINELKTGYHPPGDITFETYQSGKKRVKKAAPKGKKVEPKEDFSHLPPAKRKRKLQEKIHELEEKVAKEIQEKNAMEKMVEVYQKNPALGDAGIVIQQLEERSPILDSLNTEKFKFETWLAALENKDAPAPPKKLSSNPLPGTGPSPTPARAEMRQPVQQQPVSHPDSSDSGNEFKSEDDDDEFKSDGDEGGDKQAAIGRCRALYDFPGSNPGELAMKASDVLDLLENDENGWIRVRHGDQEGYAPLSYVEMLC